MSLTMASILMHDDLVPEGARAAIRAAYAAPPEQRAEMLESAARILYDETELDCSDVRELVDLEAGGDRGCD
jgi:hypothetical protein